MRSVGMALAAFLGTAIVLSQAASSPVRVLPGRPVVAADAPWQVFHPARRPNDSRLKPYDLDHPYPFAANFGTKEQWEKRAGELREQLLVSQGLWPMPVKTPLAPVIHGKIDRDDYTIEKVYFASMPGHYVCGNLYRPKNLKGKAPAVLNPHGHFNNGRFFEESDSAVKANLASGGEKREDGARYPLQAAAVGLCRLGCIVFHYDMVGTADSRPIPHRAGFNSVDAEMRLQNFMGLQTWNSIRALDFVCGLPDVDTSRIGVTGASGGGTQTFMLCAVDPRPTVAFPAVMVSMNMQGGCICENASLLRLGTNNVEIAALFAPKPLAMTGADDWTRDIETRGLPELKRIYGLYGAAEDVHAKYFPFPHNYNQVSREILYSWFNKHLRLGHAEPISERPFVPVEPKELSVFDPPLPPRTRGGERGGSEHPQPADFLPAERLREKMTEAAEDQIRRLAASSIGEYRKTVRTALRAMCGTSLPEPGTVKATELGSEEQPGCRIWKGTLSRMGSGEEVPTIIIHPEPNRRKEIAVVWSDPRGKAALFTAEGRLRDPIRQLVEAGVSVASADLFLTGEWHASGAEPTAAPMLPQPHHRDIPFLGFWLGYNRSVPAQRVHDLLTLAAHEIGQPGRSEVWLVGDGQAGVWTLLAKAIAGEAISKTAVNVDHFDFQSVKKPDDPMLLPGVLKYGGMQALFRASESGKVLIAGSPWNAVSIGVRHDPKPASAEELVQWLLK